MNTVEPALPEQPRSSSKASRVRTFISHPLFHLSGWIIGLVSLILAFYFYFAGKEEPLLSYSVNPVRTPIVQAGQTTALRVTYGEQILTNNVTAVQVAIWNAGRRPIKYEDVLEPISLSISNTQILEATIRKPGRTVTGVALGTNGLERGTVGVNWRILERNDGAVIQLIFAGRPLTKVSLDGTIVGQQRSIEVDLNRTSRKSEIRYYAYLGLAYCAIMGVTLLVNVRMRIRQKLQVNLKSAKGPFLYVFLPTAVISILIILFVKVPGPPFGF